MPTLPQTQFITNPAIARIPPALGYRPALPGTLYSWYGEEAFAKRWEITRALLDALEADVRADGIPLMLVILPSSPQTSENFEQLTELLHADKAEGAAFLADPLRPQKTLIAWAQEHAVISVDTLGPLKRAALEDPIYLPDRHFNALGHRIVAGEIQTALAATGLSSHVEQPLAEDPGEPKTATKVETRLHPD